MDPVEKECLDKALYGVQALEEALAEILAPIIQSSPQRVEVLCRLQQMDNWEGDTDLEPCLAAKAEFAQMLLERVRAISEA